MRVRAMTTLPCESLTNPLPLGIGAPLSVPTASTVFSYSWILLDPDDNEGFGGQIVCDGFTAEANTYAVWVLTDDPAGSPSTAVEANSWGRIKASFSSS